MKHFTLNEMEPSEQTLALIRNAARTYRLLYDDGVKIAYCLN